MEYFENSEMIWNMYHLDFSHFDFRPHHSWDLRRFVFGPKSVPQRFAETRRSWTKCPRMDPSACQDPANRGLSNISENCSKTSVFGGHGGFGFVQDCVKHESLFVIGLIEKMKWGQKERLKTTSAMWKTLRLTCVIPMMVPTTIRTRRPSTTTKY